MNLARVFAVSGLFCALGCSTSYYGARNIANVPTVPTDCAVPAASIIQKVESTVPSDATLLSAQVTCQNGILAVNTIHPNGRALVFTLPPSGQPGNAMYVIKNDQGVVTGTQTITFPASNNANNQSRLRLGFSNFSVDFRFDLVNLQKLRESCNLLNKPLVVGGAPAANEMCTMNHLASSPIARFTHNGNPLNPRVTFSCRGLEPRYVLSMTTGAVTEEIELGASDGVLRSEVAFRRTDRSRTGRGSQSAVTGTHQKNVFAENRLAIQARGQNFLVEFNPEMLLKHQQWCAIGSQIVETVPPAAPPQTAPAVEAPAEDAVILQ